MSNPFNTDLRRTEEVLSQMMTDYQAIVPECYLRFFERHVNHLAARAVSQRMLQGGRHAAR